MEKVSADIEAFEWLCKELHVPEEDRLKEKIEKELEGVAANGVLIKVVQGRKFEADSVLEEDFALRLLEVLKKRFDFESRAPLKMWFDNGDWWPAEVLALRNGRMNVLRWLLENGGNLDAVSPENDRWPLLLPLAKSEPRLAKEMVDRGANVYAVDAEGVGVLMVLCAIDPSDWNSEHRSLALAVLEKGGCEGVDAFGNAPMRYCVDSGNRAMAELLLAKSPEQAQARNARGKKPLDLAREKGCDGLAELLEGFEAAMEEERELKRQQEERLESLARVGGRVLALMEQGRLTLSLDGVELKPKDLEKLCAGQKGSAAGRIL